MAMPTRVACILLLAAAARAEDLGDRFLAQERVAFSHLEKREWDAAIAAFEEQIAIFDANPRPYYNIACAYALQGKPERAVVWLELSVRHGWRNTAHMDEDSDLDAIRGTERYKRLRRRLDDLAPIGPRPIPPSSVPPADSVTRILADGILDQARLDLDERLWEEHQIRARLFGLYDRQMARLARYIEENGDARDAHEAGRERVRLASLYRLQGAESGDDYVRVTAEEFLERWPTSPHLYAVLLWRASIGTGTAELQRLLHDAPRGDVAARAMAEIMVRDPSTRMTLYPRFLHLYRDTEVGEELLAGRLARVRLEQDGLPDGLVFEPPVADLRTGRVVIAIVTARDEASLPAPSGDRLLLVRVGDGPWPETKAPVAKDPLAAARLLGAWDVPLILVFEDGKLVEAKSGNSQD